jgi:hypothetical protein
MSSRELMNTKDSNANSSLPWTSDFEELSKCLSNLNEEELLISVQDIEKLLLEAKRLWSSKYNERFNQIIQLVPREMWKNIFASTILTQESFSRHSDFYLKDISKVCNSWKNMVHEVVIECYNIDDTKPPYFTDWVISHFSDKIEKLNLNKATNEKFGMIFDKGVKCLTRLNELSLRANNFISNRGIEYLTNIKSLDLSENYEINYEGVKRMQHLHTLCLENNRYFNDFMLMKLSSLRTLKIDICSDISSQGLSKMTNLTFLRIREDLSGVRPILVEHVIKDKGIQNLTNLEQLVLTGNRTIGNEAFMNLPKLASLALPTRATDEGLMKLSNLVDLRLNRKITDESLSIMTNLFCLDVGSNSFVSGRSIFKLTNLKTLYLRDNNNLTKEEIVQVLPNLKYLFCKGERVLIISNRKPDLVQRVTQ